MHAYAHQWSCQLVYNPRLQVGVGLTDGEGVERLWSRMRRLIGITRTSGVSTHCHRTSFAGSHRYQRSRRIWILDRQLSSIGSSHRDDLGDWLTRRHAFARRESLNNRAILKKIGFTDTELRDEWNLQRRAQLSVQAREYHVYQ